MKEDLEAISALIAISATLEQLINQLGGIAIDNPEVELKVRNVAKTLVTGTEQIRFIVDPGWFKNG